MFTLQALAETLQALLVMVDRQARAACAAMGVAVAALSARGELDARLSCSFCRA